MPSCHRPVGGKSCLFRGPPSTGSETPGKGALPPALWLTMPHGMLAGSQSWGRKERTVPCKCRGALTRRLDLGAHRELRSWCRVPATHPHRNSTPWHLRAQGSQHLWSQGHLQGQCQSLAPPVMVRGPCRAALGTLWPRTRCGRRAEARVSCAARSVRSVLTPPAPLADGVG